MIKRILKIWLTIAMYELGKWIGREVYYKLTANDEVEMPKDFNEDDHSFKWHIRRLLNELGHCDVDADNSFSLYGYTLGIDFDFVYKKE